MSTIAELRGFSNNSYVQSISNEMGGSGSFAIQLMTRQLAPKTSATPGLLVGNISTSFSRGWAFYRLQDTNSGATMSFRFVIYEGGISQTLDFSFPAALARFTNFLISYAQGVSAGVGSINVYVNGVHTAMLATSTAAYSASNGRLSFGYDVNDATGALPEASFIAFTYGAAVTAAEAADNMLETVKRGDAVQSGFAVARTFLYSVRRNGGQGGCPAVLTNYGSLGPSEGRLTVVGAANLVFGTPEFEFSGFENGSTGGSGGGGLLTPLDLYVVPAPTGNDTNDGLTPATPVQTLAGAYSKIPTYLWGAPVRIHMAQGVFTWTPIPGAVISDAEGQLIILVDGAGQPGEDGFTEVLAPSLAGASTTANSVDFAALEGAYLGYTIEFLTGAAVGQRRTVRNNTATEIVPCAPFNPAPASGDSFRIVQPSAVIDVAGSASTEFALGGDAYVTLINLAFDGAGSLENFMLAEGMDCLKMYGCLFRGEGQLSASGSKVFAGVTEVNDAVLQTKGLRLAQLWSALGGVQNWVGWGVSTHDTHLNFSDRSFDSVAGYIVSFGALSWAYNRASEYAVTFLGGYVGGLFAQGSGSVQFINFDDASIPTLLRWTNEVAFALYSWGADFTVLGGRAAIDFDLSDLDDPLSGAVRIVNGTLAWVGPSTITIPAGAGGRVFEFVNANVNFTLAEGDNFQLNMAYGVGVSCLDNSQVSIVTLSGQSTWTVSLDPGFQEAIALSVLSGSSFVGSEQAGGLSLICSSQTPNSYVGAIILGTSRVLLASIFTDNAALAISAPQTGTCDLGAFQVTNGLSGVSFGSGSRLAVSSQGFGGARIFTSSAAVIASANAQITMDVLEITADGPALAATISSTIIANVTSETPLTGNPGVVVVDSNITIVSGGITSPAANNALVQGEGHLVLSGNMAFSAGSTNFVVTIGSTVSFLTADVQSFANTSGDGVDCTGGGQAYFNTSGTPPVFTIAGNELVVGPGAGEQKSFALALPNPGDSFSNAGAGSSMTRYT